MNDNLPPMAFKDRCTVAVECLPNAPYRTMLANLLDEMLAAIERQSVPTMNALSKRRIYDAIRGAYDMGYSDARNAGARAGDSAPGYKGRDIEQDHGGALLSAINAQLAAAPQPQPVQEPVADIKITGNDFDLGLTDAFAFGRLRLPDGHYQLYTSPQAQPLTHLQAKALVEKYGNDPLHLIFQTEAAHGITKGTT